MKKSARSTHSRLVVPRTVGDAMHRGVVTCKRGASIVAAARVMAAHHIHATVVVDFDGRCVGIVTAGDLVAGLDDGTAASRTVDEIASVPALIGPHEPLVRAVELMRDHRTTHIVVTLASRRPVGMLSALDLLELVADTGRGPGELAVLAENPQPVRG